MERGSDVDGGARWRNSVVTDERRTLCVLLKVPPSVAPPASSLPSTPAPRPPPAPPPSRPPASLQGRRRVLGLALPLAAVTGSAILRVPYWSLPARHIQ